MGKCTKACGTINSNFGVKESNIFGKARKIMFVPLVSDAGVDNSIDLTSALDKVYFDGLKSKEDYSERFQFTPLLDNIVPNIEDDASETLAFNRTIFTREGNIGYEVHWNSDKSDAVFQRALKSLQNGKWGFYFVDKCSSVAGYECSDKLFPIPISEGTVSVKLIETDPNTSNYIRLIFQIDPSGSNDYDLLLGENLNDDVNLLNIKGLYDGKLNAKVGAATTTELVVDLEVLSSSVTSTPFTGADTVGNWTMTNNTTSLAVVLATVVEDAIVDGRYTFTFPAQTAADSVTLKYLDAKGEIIFTTTLD